MLRPDEIDSLLGLDWSGDTKTFTDYYQDGNIPGAKYLSFTELVRAAKNTRELIGQFELSSTNVVKLAEAIFRRDQRLIEDVTVHQIGNENYLIGGRHRLFAILNVFDQIARHPEGVPTSTLYKQVMRVTLKFKPDLSYLADDIVANNESRSMLKAESLGIKAHKQGALARDPLSFVSSALKNHQTAGEITDTAGLYFVWAFKSSQLNDHMRGVVGKILSKYILFGKSRLTPNSPLVVTTTPEFEVIAKALWVEIEDIVGDRDLLAKQAQQVAMDAIARHKKKAT